MIFYENPFVREEELVPHCCLHCGWKPIEGMRDYLSIHGEKAECLGPCYLDKEVQPRLLPHPPGPFVDPYPSDETRIERMREMCDA